MTSSANTFGTFLDTFKKLESARPSGGSSFPETEVLQVAKMLAGTGGQAPVQTAMKQSDLPEPDFLRAVFAGKEKGIFEIDETSDQAVLKLTKLGRGFAG